MSVALSIRRLPARESVVRHGNGAAKGFAATRLIPWPCCFPGNRPYLPLSKVSPEGPEHRRFTQVRLASGVSEMLAIDEQVESECGELCAGSSDPTCDTPQLEEGMMNQ